MINEGCPPGWTRKEGEKALQTKGRQAVCNFRKNLGLSLTLQGALECNFCLRISPHWR